MPKFRAYIKVPADSNGEIKKIITKTIEANTSVEALASLRGQYGVNNVNTVSQLMPKHRSIVKSSNKKKNPQENNQGTIKNNNRLNKPKLSTSKKLSGPSNLVNELEKTSIGRKILAFIGLTGFIFITIIFLTMDNNIQVGVYEVSADYGSNKILITNTSKKIIMKDEIKNLKNNNSKYLDEVNKINHSLLCESEKISKENCTFEVLKYAICNYEFSQIKSKYFKDILPQVEKHIDWKGRLQDWNNKYGSRYDYSINLLASFFQTIEEQKNTKNYEFFCN